MRVARSGSVACAAVFAIVACLEASAAEPPAGADAARTSVAESVGTIEAGDLLRLSVSGLSGPMETTRDVRVGADGTVRPPYLAGVKVAGQATADAERAIAKAYHDEHILQSAVVSVLRVEAGSRAAEKGGPLMGGDRVLVTIGELAGPGQESAVPGRVEADGSVRLPIVGSVKVAGLSEADAERAVAKAYRDAHLMQRPDVSVRRLARAGDEKAQAGPLAPGDLVELSMLELLGPGRKLTKLAHVGADGEIGVPYVGAVKVGGETEAAAAAAVAKALHDGNIIQMPIVWLTRADVPAATGMGGPIAAGDVLRVGVAELAGPGAYSVRLHAVTTDGSVRVPLVPQAVKVAGLGESAAEAAIAKAYREAGVLRNGIVTVLRVDPKARLADVALDSQDPDPPPPAKGKEGR